MDVAAVGVGLTPAQQDEALKGLSLFLDRFGSTRAVRIKLQEQKREIELLEAQVRYLLIPRNGGISSQAKGKARDNDKESSGHRAEAEESVDDTMADLGFFLRKFGSTRAVREKLETQERKIVGLRRTVQWFRDRRGNGGNSDGSSDVEYLRTESAVSKHGYLARKLDGGEKPEIIVLDDDDGGDDPAEPRLEAATGSVKRLEGQPKVA